MTCQHSEWRMNAAASTSPCTGPTSLAASPGMAWGHMGPEGLAPKWGGRMQGDGAQGQREARDTSGGWAASSRAGPQIPIGPFAEQWDPHILWGELLAGMMLGPDPSPNHPKGAGAPQCWDPEHPRAGQWHPNHDSWWNWTLNKGRLRVDHWDCLLLGTKSVLILLEVQWDMKTGPVRSIIMNMATFFSGIAHS